MVDPAGGTPRQHLAGIATEAAMSTRSTPRGSIITYEMILTELRRRSFAVLSTVDDRGRPHAVGVEYGVAPDGTAIYVMTRRKLKKARNIAACPDVALVVPLTRRLPWFLPPPCIQFQGAAEILDRADAGGIETFNAFPMGRLILKMYAAAERRGETGVCFLRITPGPRVFTYAVGRSIWALLRRMEGGAEMVEVPAAYRR
jgi:hypothetical protein